MSREIEQELHVKETKPPIVNQQCVVYSFQCDLCDAGYVAGTHSDIYIIVEKDPLKKTILRHCQTLQERARDDASGPAKAFRNAQEMQKKSLLFSVRNAFLRALKPNLNVQSDSIRAKVFS